MFSWLRRLTLGDAEPTKVYICNNGHDDDRTYAENVVQYLESQGALCRSATLRAGGLRPELQLCLDDRGTAVLGFNSTLDHSWLSSGSFLTAAENARVPVLQWILDHPSARWHEQPLSAQYRARAAVFRNLLPAGRVDRHDGRRRPEPALAHRSADPANIHAAPDRLHGPLSLHRVCGVAENDEGARRLVGRCRLGRDRERAI
jgi:hypothetical protein